VKRLPMGTPTFDGGRKRIGRKKERQKRRLK